MAVSPLVQKPVLPQTVRREKVNDYEEVYLVPWPGEWHIPEALRRQFHQ